MAFRTLEALGDVGSLFDVDIGLSTLRQGRRTGELATPARSRAHRRSVRRLTLNVLEQVTHSYDLCSGLVGPH